MSATLLVHANVLTFLVGAALVFYGMARWSLAAACVLLGSILMTVAAWPYLRFPKRKA